MAGLTVNTNISALNALNHLNKTQGMLTGSMSRISSGLRITKAADDAAGLATAENLDAQKRSLRQASRNTNDGVSVVQTAEGSTNEVSNIIKRMRELAVQSSSETLASSERTYIQDEFLQLTAEVDRIAAVTEFNGQNLTDGVATTMDVQVGIFNSTDNRITISLGNLTSSALGVTTGGVDLSTVTGAQLALSTLDTALDTLNSYRSDYGATQNRLGSAMRNLATYTENLTTAESTIRDADFAHETAQMAKFQIMQQAGVSILAQANTLPQAAIRLLG